MSASFVEAASQDLSGRITFRPAAKKACVFNFPKDFTLGQINIADYPGEAAEKCRSGAARGQINVPAGKYVTFVPSRRFYEKPDLILCLPPIGVDCLEITASSMDDSEDGMCDRALARIGRLKSLIKLNLDRSDASDKGAIFARDLPEVQEISAFAAMIEGTCFADFARLKNLRVLALNCNPIKDENLKYLSAVSRLDALNLSSTGISDNGVRNLIGCSKLTFLDIGANAKITDRSVDNLIKLKSLNGLVLGGTSISYNGLMRLKGMALEYVMLPGRVYTIDQFKNLRKAFPKVVFVVPGGARAVNPETNAMYAPLH
ncbi:MAG: hypothetical protein KGS72_12680 [Cyanobacteria bacterium REEB67]|nr:hypothetical protein [Cyanobacteria bacterium REEB67]